VRLLSLLVGLKNRTKMTTKLLKTIHITNHFDEITRK